MRIDDVELPDDDAIEAALEEALDRPLEQLLSIEEFAEKFGTTGRSSRTELPGEARRAA